MNNHPQNNRRAPGSAQIRPRPDQRPGYSRGRNNTFYLTVIISAIITVAIVTVIIVAALNYANGKKNPGGNNPDPRTDTDAKNEFVLKETPDAGQSYIDSMIFVGDSNTAHMRYFAVLNGGKETKQVWAPESQTLTLNSEIANARIVYPETGASMTIAEAAALKKPKYIVINLGTNGVNALDKDQFKYCYKKLTDSIKKASPSTVIIIQSIYPVTSTYNAISSETINRANEWLVEFCGENSLYYVDTASVLKDGKGFMKEEFNSFHLDGYHVNKEAYDEILKYLRTHAYIEK